MQLHLDIDRRDLVASAIVVRGIEVRPSGQALLARLEGLYADLREGRAGATPARRKAVRALLRNGRYSPSGRGKPACEYLDAVFREKGSLDLISNAVDANNLVSLRHGLPVSAFDGALLRGDLRIRLGRDGERYLFNASGQELHCRDLVVVCDDRGPIGSPVKDSQATKLFPGATGVVYVVYANGDDLSPEALVDLSAELGAALVDDCPGAEASAPRLFARP